VPAVFRLLCALAAFPLGWALREAAGGVAGGIFVLTLIAGAAWDLPRPVALRVAAAGVLCFVAVHLIAFATTIYVGLALGAVAFAAIGSALWRDGSSSSARRATRAT
jgi:hypothetical protein